MKKYLGKTLGEWIHYVIVLGALILFYHFNSIMKPHESFYIIAGAFVVFVVTDTIAEKYLIKGSSR